MPVPNKCLKGVLTYGEETASLNVHTANPSTQHIIVHNPVWRMQGVSQC